MSFANILLISSTLNQRIERNRIAQTKIYRLTTISHQFKTRLNHPMMPLLNLHPLLALALFFPLHDTAYPPQCSFIFGHPDFDSCTKLLVGSKYPISGRVATRGISNLDRRDHLFCLPIVMLRPPETTRAQWENRIFLPQPLFLDAEQPVASQSGPVPWSNGK